ncbi:MAG: ATP synthase subunit I [Spirochaetales bacterium]|jgi:F1F0 ATPase subunit 2|nr:ATP synthase subunit I [Spirochaetales bacterium]
MNEMVILILAAGAGILLGVFFFGGLWWTVRKCVSSRNPAPLVLSSMVLRTGVILTGFYFISSGHWDRLLLCLLGFIIARFIVTRLTDMYAEHHNSLSKESSHAT